MNQTIHPLMFNWVQEFSDWVTHGLLGTTHGSKSAETLNFFIYDTIKIFLLLALVTFIMGFINSWMPVDKVRHFLTTRRWYGLDYLVASLFGTVTPFCSCSSVPLFIGFVKGGIPLGVTFAFLISSPLVDAVTVAIFIGMFGLKITLIYVLSGILLSIVAAYFLSMLKLEPLLTEWAKRIIEDVKPAATTRPGERVSFLQRISTISAEAFSIVKGVAIYIVVGVAIGAVMHGYVPTGFFEEYISKDNPLGVPLAVILGIPMYSNTAGILPVMLVLVEKGIPLGTVIAFSMAVVALSVPEAMLLRKVMTTRMLFIFFAVVTACIIVSGYLFNLLL